MLEMKILVLVNSFIGTQTYSFLSISSMADFALSGSNIVAVQTRRPTKLKILTV